MLLTRRRLFTSLGAIVAAPAIVRVESLMPVKAWFDADADMITAFWADPTEACSRYKYALVAAFERLERSTMVLRNGDGRLIRVAVPSPA